MQPEGKPNLDSIAQRVKSLFKFKSFYDHMYFNPEQNINNAIIKLTDPSRRSGLVESKLRRNSRFADDIVEFYNNDRGVIFRVITTIPCI